MSIQIEALKAGDDMADKAWKAFERDIAAEFGTTRQLMKGTSEKAEPELKLESIDLELEPIDLELQNIPFEPEDVQK